MISQAGGNDEQSGISWYIHMMYGWVVRVNNIAFYIWVGLGGIKDNTPFQMKNNVKPIKKTLGWAGGGAIKE